MAPGKQCLDGSRQRAAGHHDAIVGHALVGQLDGVGVDGRTAHVRDLVDQQAVALFWHGAIAAAQASLDVDQRNAAGIRRERTRQSRVRVTLDDDRTRGVRQQVGRHRGGG